MRQTTGTRKSPGEKLVKDIKRATRKPDRTLRGRHFLALPCDGW